MITDLFINVCNKTLKVSKADTGGSSPFKDMEERQAAYNLFTGNGVEIVYDKDEGKGFEEKDGQFRIIVENDNLSYVLHVFDENGFVRAMTEEEAGQVKMELDGKGIGCLVETVAAKDFVGTGKPVKPPKPDNAVTRLDNQYKKSKLDKESKEMAKPLVDFLLEKCKEDAVFALLVLQEHKTFDKCFEYIKEAARKKAKQNFCGMYGTEVCKLAVAYFEKDDAEEERKKAEEATKREAEAKEREAKRKEEAEKIKAEPQKVPPAKAPAPPTPPKIIKEQVSLFA